MGVGGDAVDRLRRQGDNSPCCSRAAVPRLSGVMAKTPTVFCLYFLLLYCFASAFLRSARRGSTTRSRSPSSTPCRLRSVLGQCGGRSHGPAGSCRCVSFRCGHRCRPGSVGRRCIPRRRRPASAAKDGCAGPLRRGPCSPAGCAGLGIPPPYRWAGGSRGWTRGLVDVLASRARGWEGIDAQVFVDLARPPRLRA